MVPRALHQAHCVIYTRRHPFIRYLIFNYFYRVLSIYNKRLYLSLRVASLTFKRL